MQLYAFDDAGSIVFSCRAQKKLNYSCMECGSVIRLREGPFRHAHFYHIQKTPTCRQNGKSDVHIQLQIYIKNLIPETFLEFRFPEINRIADVVWHAEKIVFEIQCSPMSPSEMQARYSDYKKVGYQMVLILHDSRYNQWRLSSMELMLGDLLHYYTNKNETGEGIIYDQWSHHEKGLRKKYLPPIPVDLSKPYIKEKLGFSGDIQSLPSGHPYLEKIKAHEDSALFNKRKKIFTDLLNSLKIGIKDTYKNLLKSYCED